MGLPPEWGPPGPASGPEPSLQRFLLEEVEQLRRPPPAGIAVGLRRFPAGWQICQRFGGGCEEPGQFDGRCSGMSIRLAASRAVWTAGSSKPISTATMPITTSTSTRVSPRAGLIIGVKCLGIGTNRVFPANGTAMRQTTDKVATALAVCPDDALRCAGLATIWARRRNIGSTIHWISRPWSIRIANHKSGTGRQDCELVLPSAESPHSCLGEWQMPCPTGKTNLAESPYRSRG